MAVVLLFVLMLFVMLLRVFMPKGVKSKGKVTHKFKLSLVERYLFQRTNLYSIGALLLLMTATGSMPTGLQFIVLIVVQGFMLIPVRVVCTTEGIAINNVVYRPWSEFAGYTTSHRRISLIGREGTRPLNVPFLANHQKDVITAIGRHLPEIKERKEAGAEKRLTVG